MIVYLKSFFEKLWEQGKGFIARRRYFTCNELISVIDSGSKNKAKKIKIGTIELEFETLKEEQ